HWRRRELARLVRPSERLVPAAEQEEGADGAAKPDRLLTAVADAAGELDRAFTEVPGLVDPVGGVERDRQIVVGPHRRRVKIVFECGRECAVEQDASLAQAIAAQVAERLVRQRLGERVGQIECLGELERLLDIRYRFVQITTEDQESAEL